MTNKMTESLLESIADRLPHFLDLDQIKERALTIDFSCRFHKFHGIVIHNAMVAPPLVFVIVPLDLDKQIDSVSKCKRPTTIIGAKPLRWELRVGSADQVVFAQSIQLAVLLAGRTRARAIRPRQSAGAFTSPTRELLMA